MADEKPNFTAAEIEVAIEAMFEEEAVLSSPVTRESSRILYTGLERSGVMPRLQKLSLIIGQKRFGDRNPIEAALHFGFTLGFNVRSTLLDAAKLQEMYAREG